MPGLLATWGDCSGAGVQSIVLRLVYLESSKREVGHLLITADRLAPSENRDNTTIWSQYSVMFSEPSDHRIIIKLAKHMMDTRPLSRVIYHRSNDLTNATKAAAVAFPSDDDVSIAIRDESFRKTEWYNADHQFLDPFWWVSEACRQFYILAERPPYYHHNAHYRLIIKCGCV